MSGPLDKLDGWLRLSEDISGMAAVQSFNDFGLHKGIAHQGSWTFSGTAAGEFEQTMLICPDEWDCHASIMMNSGGDAIFELYESPTVTTSGTEQDPRTLNRSFAVEGGERAFARGFVSPTLADAGYLLTRQLLPGGIGAIAGAEANDEWVLRRGRAYVFRLYNWTAGAELLGMRVKWLEHNHSPAIDGL